MGRAPWDNPTPPTKGDRNPTNLYHWVGRFMSQWVHLEFSLSLMRSTFVNEHNKSEAVQSYGIDRQFKDRLSDLKKVACEFFILHPDQNLEGQFDTICIAVEGFQKRRNEVAHAVVQPSVFLPSFIDDRVHQRDSWALAPPHYERRHFDIQGVPSFVHTSLTLNDFIGAMIDLKNEIEVFREAINRLDADP